MLFMHNLAAQDRYHTPKGYDMYRNLVRTGADALAPWRSPTWLSKYTVLLSFQLRKATQTKKKIFIVVICDDTCDGTWYSFYISKRYVTVCRNMVRFQTADSLAPRGSCVGNCKSFNERFLTKRCKIHYDSFRWDWNDLIDLPSRFSADTTEPCNFHHRFTNFTRHIER